MHLISDIDQFIHVDQHKFHFRRGEKIITEFSHKYWPEEFAALAAQAGFKFVRIGLTLHVCSGYSILQCSACIAPAIDLTAQP